MKNYILILLLLAGQLTSIAQKVDRSKPPAPGPAPMIELGKYESFVLENGLKVIVVENHKLPKVTFQIFVDSDPVLQGEHTGYVNMMGSLLKSGTETRNKSDIDQAIDFIGADLSSSANGVYVSGLSKHKETMFELMSDILLHPVFPEDELEKLKKQTLSGLATIETNANAMVSNVSKVLSYGKEHPYGEVETKQTIESITRDLCVSHYKTYFKPNISYLIVVGDIKLDEAKKLANKYLGNWAKAEVPKHTYNIPVPPHDREVAFIDKTGAVQSVISITYPVDLKPGSKDAIPAKLMNGILGASGFMARLIQDLREDHGYTYGAYSSLTADALVGRFSTSASVRNEVTDSAIVRFLYQMNRIRTEKVSEEDLQNVKNYISGQFARSLEHPQVIARFALNIARYNLPEDYYATYLKKVEAVTVDDIQAVADKYILPGNCYIVVAGNQDEVSAKLKQFATSGKVNYYDAFGNPVSNTKPIPEGLTAQKVIDNYLEAIGGADKLKAVKSEKIIMTTTMNNMPVKMTLMIDMPDKYMQQLEASGMLINQIIVNGGKGKMRGMQGEKSLSPEEVEQVVGEIAIFDQLTYPETKELKLVSVENIDGNDAYKMEVKSKDGSVVYEYYDAKTGFLVKTVETQETPQGAFTIEKVVSDYKDVDGIKVPYKLTINQAGQLMEFDVADVVLNPELNPEIFKL